MKRRSFGLSKNPTALIIALIFFEKIRKEVFNLIFLYDLGENPNLPWIQNKEGSSNE